VDEEYRAHRSTIESAAIRSVWSSVSGDRFWDGCAPPRTLATIDDVRFVSQRLRPQAASRFVDLGCGSGCLGRHLADAFGAYVLGMDANALMVRLAQEHSRDGRYAGNLEFETRDVAATGQPDNAFDGAASLDVLLFVSDKQAALRETRRILKPGACFVGTTFELRAPSPSLSSPAFDDYPAAFEATGFVLEDYEETEAWRPLLEQALAGLLAHDAEIAREVHPTAHERLRNWARTRPSELGDSRRVRFCARKA
jgi:2-polyprenyl-3-methyl-5-hydroxy-6-metoxy-1,4-benzoquinol methylase